MCTLCDAGKPQNHSTSQLGRRDFLKASTATAAAAAGMSLFNAPPAAAHGDDGPRDSGRPGRRYVIRNGHVMSMDPKVGDFVRGDVLVEGKKILAVGPQPACRRRRRDRCRRQDRDARLRRHAPPPVRDRDPQLPRRRAAVQRRPAARRDQLLPVHPRHLRPGVPAARRLHQRAVRLAQPARRRRHDLARHLADPLLAAALRRRDQGQRRLRAAHRVRLSSRARAPT